MANILITGGTGLIGQHLIPKLEAAGHRVRILSRNPESKSSRLAFFWDVNSGRIDPEAFANLDYIIHLAGANIAEGKWTEARKKEIVDSRVKSAGMLLDQVKKQKVQLKAFISSSAVGYYGAVTSDKIYKEEDLPYNDFMGSVCEQWEEAALEFKKLGIRTVMLRTGVVLAKDGGMVARLSGPAKWGVASPLGTGKQYVPWIHINDLVSIYIKALADEAMDGAFNAVAPEHVTNKQLVARLAKTINRAVWLPAVPGFALRIVFGEMAAIITEGSRVSSDKLSNYGFEFQYPGLDEALKQLLKTS